MATTTLIFFQKLCSIFLLMSLQFKNSRSESEINNLSKYTAQPYEAHLSGGFATIERIHFDPVATAKNLHKRAISVDDEADEVFRQLKFELNADNTERIQTNQEEKEESDKIFQELFEEMTSPKSVRKGNKDSETVQRITDTIGKFIFRGRKGGSDSSNILRLISNVFNARPRNS